MCVVSNRQHSKYRLYNINFFSFHHFISKLFSCSTGDAWLRYVKERCLQSRVPHFWVHSCGSQRQSLECFFCFLNLFPWTSVLPPDGHKLNRFLYRHFGPVLSVSEPGENFTKSVNQRTCSSFKMKVLEIMSQLKEDIQKIRTEWKVGLVIAKIQAMS